MVAKTPKPPYYAVIFSSVKTANHKDYAETAERMVELAKQQNGFLGIESARNEMGITVSYWRDLESIKNWKNNAEHTVARERGRKNWYQSYKTRIARVEHDYAFERD